MKSEFSSFSSLSFPLSLLSFLAHSLSLSLKPILLTFLASIYSAFFPSLTSFVFTNLRSFSSLATPLFFSSDLVHYSFVPLLYVPSLSLPLAFRHLAFSLFLFPRTVRSLFLLPLPACPLTLRGFDPPCYSLSLWRDLVHFLCLPTPLFPSLASFWSSPFCALFSFSRPRSLSFFLTPFASRFPQSLFAHPLAQPSRLLPTLSLQFFFSLFLPFSLYSSPRDY